MTIDLGGLVLPKYKSLNVEIIELSSLNRTLNGSVRKDVFAIKKRYIFEFENLNRTETELIENLYLDTNEKALLIDMPDLQVSTTVVLNIPNFEKKWSAKMNTFKLILEEI